MRWSRSLELVQVHCQGEIGKVIVGGAPEIPGATMLDKMNHINQCRRQPAAVRDARAARLRPDVGQPADRADPARRRRRLHRAAIGSRPCDVRQQLHVRGDGSARDRPRSDAGAGDHRPPGYAGGPRGGARQVRGWPLRVGQPRQRRRVRGGAGQDDRDASAGDASRPTSRSAASTTRIVDVDQLGIAIEPQNARALAEAGIELKDKLAEAGHRSPPGAGRHGPRLPTSCSAATNRMAPSAPAPPCGRPGRPLALRHRQLRQPRRAARARRRSRSATRRTLALDHRRRVHGGSDRRRLRSAAARRSCRGSPGRPGSTAREQLRLDDRDPFPDGFVAVGHLGFARRLTNADQR